MKQSGPKREVMGTVRVLPKSSGGPDGNQWNCPRGAANVMRLLLYIKKEE